MANPKIECPNCEGSGVQWENTDDYEEDDCTTCNGEGEVDEVLL